MEAIRGHFFTLVLLDFDDERKNHRFFASLSSDGTEALLVDVLLNLIEVIDHLGGEEFLDRGDEDLADVLKNHVSVFNKDEATHLDVWSRDDALLLAADGEGKDHYAFSELGAVIDDVRAHIADTHAVDQEVAMRNLLVNDLRAFLVDDDGDAILNDEDVLVA